MSENDTNPQRYEVPRPPAENPSVGEQSDAAQGEAGGGSGQLMVTQAIPVPNDADTGATRQGEPGESQPDRPVVGTGYPTDYPGYPAQPATGGQFPGAAPVPGAAPAGHGPWQRPPAGPGGQVPSGQVPSGQVPSGQAPGAPVSGGPGMPVSGMPASGMPAAGMPGGFTGPTGQQPLWPGQGEQGYRPEGEGPWYGAPAPGVPGQPPYGTGPVPAHRPGRFGRLVGVGLLAVLLTAGGGVIGGLIVHGMDGNSSSAITSSTAHSTTPVLERGSLASIANKIKPSVVSIQTQDAEGSGVVLTADGYILTNNHVVADAQGGTVQVTLSSGKTVSAKIVGTDAKTDLAVIKASTSGLTPATFGDSDALQVGDTVLAVGSPLGLEGSVTEGIVSALNRTIQESGSQQQNPFGQQQSQSGGTNIAGAIQTDAAINPGNSGGALVNLNAEVVGINTAIATSGSGEGNIGVGFAIPANRAKQVAQQLINHQSVSHPYLGVNVSTADGNAGAMVASVVSGSPAAKAGLKQGDVITKAGSTEIHTSDDLINVVQGSKTGTQMALTVTRSGASMTVSVTIGES